MSTKRRSTPLIYWDTCIFFAWIKQESVWPESVTKGIEQTIERAYAQQLVILTSVVTLTEVLQSQLKPEDKERYRKIFGHPHLQLMDADRRVCSRAADIRQFYDTRVFDASGNRVSGSFMSLGDSLQLATAIQFRVDEFQTLDGSGKRQHRIDLLKLNGSVANIRLVIVQPKYIEPPKPLEGPVVETPTGAQIPIEFPEAPTPTEERHGADAGANVDDDKQRTENENEESTTVTSPVDVRPSPDGLTENSAGAKGEQAPKEEASDLPAQSEPEATIKAETIKPPQGSEPPQ